MAAAGRTLTPVVLAGLSFLALAGVLLPLGRSVGSSSIYALGLEAAFDGLFYLVGGLASHWLERSRRHALWCYTRESVELMALGSGVVFAIGAFVQPSHGSGAPQAIGGVIGAIIAVALAWFWHPRLEEHGHHEGFDRHLIADAILATSVALATLAVLVSGQAAWSFWGAVAGAVVALGLNTRAAITVARRLWHRPSNHPSPHPRHTH